MAKPPACKLGMPIAKLSTILKKCREAVKSSVTKNEVNVTTVDSTPTKAIHYIHFGYFCSAMDKDDEREIPVSLFVSSPASPFWLCLALQVEHIGKKDFLTHASIKILNGLAASQEKNLCFRAEWDPRDEKHAQPHWHLDLALPESGTQPLPTFQELIEQEAERAGFERYLEREKEILQVPAETKTLSSFHFAMCTNWHEGKKDYNHALSSEDAFLHWLRSVLRYIKEQLEYVNSGYQKVA